VVVPTSQLTYRSRPKTGLLARETLSIGIAHGMEELNTRRKENNSQDPRNDQRFEALRISINDLHCGINQSAQTEDG
jgi:hypothetical protein